MKKYVGFLIMFVIGIMIIWISFNPGIFDDFTPKKTYKCTKCYDDQIITCGTCRGKGRELCDSCGDSWNVLGKCFSCDGDGKTSMKHKDCFCDNGFVGYQVCPGCNGTGTLYYKDTCSWCNGSGVCSECHGSGLKENAQTCSDCKGTTTVTCPECK